MIKKFNYKLFVGSNLYNLYENIVTLNAFPLKSIVPYGFDFTYDIQRFLGKKELSIIFDVGANVGGYSKRFNKYFKNADIFAFEPINTTYEILNQNLCGNNKIKSFNLGLGEKIGELFVNLVDDSEKNSFKNKSIDNTEGGNCQKVDLDTLDNFCDSCSINFIDLLKLDVEGYEINVLKGAKKFLENNKINFIYSEVSFNSSDSYKVLHSELYEMLKGYGFNLCGFYETKRWNQNKYIAFTNALFHNPDFNKS